MNSLILEGIIDIAYIKLVIQSEEGRSACVMTCDRRDAPPTKLL